MQNPESSKLEMTISDFIYKTTRFDVEKDPNKPGMPIIPEGWEMDRSMGSFRYRLDGSTDEQIETYVLPRVRDILAIGDNVAIGVPKDETEKRDGVLYLFRKINDEETK